MRSILEGETMAPVKIEKTYLGKIGEKETIDDVESACAFAGGDFALEYTGANLHIFRVMTGVRS